MYHDSIEPGTKYHQFRRYEQHKDLAPDTNRNYVILCPAAVNTDIGSTSTYFTQDIERFARG